MRNQATKSILSRRAFLKEGGRRIAGLGLSATAAASLRQARAQTGDANPFAYDMGAWEKTDPKLVGYQEVKRITPPRKDARRVAVDGKDRLCVAAGNYVTVLDNGATVSEIALTGPARCLAVAKDGMVYAGLREKIEVFGPDGARKAAWDVPGGQSWLTGLAVAENDLFAADAKAKVVLRFDRGGKLLGRIGEKNAERDVPGFVVPSPYFDLELHPDGLLRVANPGRHKIEAYTFNGDLERSWGRPSAAIDGFCGCCNPVNIAVTPDGSIVTCEKGLPRVKVYTVDGVLKSVVAGTESFPENAKAGHSTGDSDGTKAGLDAAVDSRGQVYVLDMATGRVLLMAPKLAAGQAASL